MKIEGVGTIYKTFKSVGKVVTHATKYGIDIIRQYRVPKLPLSLQVDTVDTIHSITKDSWVALSEVDKEAWNTLAEEGYLTGFQLYEQESWKAFINTSLNKGSLGTCRLAGSIKSGRGVVCGDTVLGIGYLNGNYPF